MYLCPNISFVFWWHTNSCRAEPQVSLSSASWGTSVSHPSSPNYTRTHTIKIQTQTQPQIQYKCIENTNTEFVFRIVRYVTVSHGPPNYSSTPSQRVFKCPSCRLLGVSLQPMCCFKSFLPTALIFTLVANNLLFQCLFYLLGGCQRYLSQ